MLKVRLASTNDTLTLCSGLSLQNTNIVLFCLLFLGEFPITCSEISCALVISARLEQLEIYGKFNVQYLWNTKGSSTENIHKGSQ